MLHHKLCGRWAVDPIAYRRNGKTLSTLDSYFVELQVQPLTVALAGPCARVATRLHAFVASPDTILGAYLIAVAVIVIDACQCT